MDKFLKSYQKFLGLDYPIVDKFIRIIFLLNIPLFILLNILSEEILRYGDEFPTHILPFGTKAITYTDGYGVRYWVVDFYWWILGAILMQFLINIVPRILLKIVIPSIIWSINWLIGPSLIREIASFFKKDILLKIRSLRNGLKIILSITTVVWLSWLFDLYIDIFSINSSSNWDKGGEAMMIDGLHFNEDSLLFFIYILFTYWIFWGHKKD